MRLFRLGSAVLLVVLTDVIIRQTQQALTIQVQVQQAFTPGGKITLYRKAFLETITFGIYDGASTEVATIEDQIAAWQQAQRVVRRATGAFVLLALLLLGSVVVDGRRQSPALTWRKLSVHTVGVSALLLVLGMTTLLVTMTVTGTVPGLGSALIQATTKGVQAAIGDLWATQPFLALLVLVFSVVLPIVKLSLTAWMLASTRLPQRLVRVLQMVGKWSMADVFVVAVLIVLLSPVSHGTLLQTSTQAGIGLYFFAASCVLSLLTTLLGRSIAAHGAAPGRASRLLGAGDDA